MCLESHTPQGARNWELVLVNLVAVIWVVWELGSGGWDLASGVAGALDLGAESLDLGGLRSWMLGAGPLGLVSEIWCGLGAVIWV